MIDHPDSVDKALDKMHKELQKEEAHLIIRLSQRYWNVYDG